MDIKYNTPIEVNYKQLYECCKQLCGVLDWQEKEGKFFVKLWYMQYKIMLQNILSYPNGIPE